MIDGWYRYAANAPGFIGSALKTQRGKAFLMQEQQRNLLGILDNKYDQFWSMLQAMPLPRNDQLEADLQRIIEYVAGKAGIEASVDMGQLKELIQIGLEP